MVAIQAINRGNRAWCACGASMVIIALALSAVPAAAQDAATTPRSETSSQPAPASDQKTGLEDIIVTAERRPNDAQKTAASITVQNGDDLLARGKFTLRNILETVPNVSGGESEGATNEPTGSDSPASGITIRGVASNGGPAGVTLSGIPATALYVDDVYSGIGGNFDIDRVEVLRGPQGTLYGRSATAGLVAIHTRNPDLTKFGGDATAEYGSYDLLHVSAALNVPIVSDKLALRISGNRYQRDGVDVETGFGRSRVTEGRAKLLFQPNDDVSLLIGGAFQDKRLYNGGIAGVLTQPDHIDYQPFAVGSADTKYRQVWGELNWDLGGVRLTYLPSYRTWDQDAKVVVVGPGGGALNSLVRTPHDIFITHELRLRSDSGARIQWQTGLFSYSNDIRNSNRNIWQESKGLLFEADTARRTRDIGVFAEVTIPLAKGLRLTGGLRYDKTIVRTQETYTSNLNVFCNTPLGFITGCTIAPPDSPSAGLPEALVSIAVSGDAGRRKFENVTYKARLEYDLSPTSLLYASVSTGFLPGDVQIGTGAGNQPVVYPYNSEQLTAFELGSKNRFFDRRLQINLGVFHYDYAGYQASILLDPANPGSAVLFNVPLRMTGVEAEALFQATPDDRLGLNFSYIGSRFHNLPAGFANAVAERKLWGFAPASATASYDHVFRFGGSTLDLRAEGIWRSAYDASSTSPALAAQGALPYIRQRAFFLGNLSLTWTAPDDRISVTGYVRNVTNERYKTYLNLQSMVPLQATGTQSDPRTLGGVMTVRF